MGALGAARAQTQGRHPVRVRWRIRARGSAAGEPKATPYTLRHSFSSLLLHEGRSVIYVARQMGHDALLTLSTYGHVIDQLEGRTADPGGGRDPAARSGSCVTGVSRRPKR